MINQNQKQVSFSSRGTFVTRNKSIDYIKSVNDILRNPNNNLSPSSSLYQSALSQYNENTKKGSLTRLSVPKGFCGFTDPRTGQFKVVTDEEYNRLLTSGQVITSRTPKTKPVVEGLIPYSVDECLQYGLPGTAEYDTCQQNSEDYEDGSSEIPWHTECFEDEAIETCEPDVSAIPGSGDGPPEEDTHDGGWDWDNAWELLFEFPYSGGLSAIFDEDITDYFSW